MEMRPGVQKSVEVVHDVERHVRSSPLIHTISANEQTEAPGVQSEGDAQTSEGRCECAAEHGGGTRRCSHELV